MSFNVLFSFAYSLISQVFTLMTTYWVLSLVLILWLLRKFVDLLKLIKD